MRQHRLLNAFQRHFAMGRQIEIILKRGDRARAEDLLQETFVDAMRGYDAFRGDASVVTWLLTIALCGLLAHSCIAKALAIAPSTVVAPIDFARLPLIAVVAMLLYGEPLDPWVFLGAAIIFAGNYLNIWSETRREA